MERDASKRMAAVGLGIVLALGTMAALAACQARSQSTEGDAGGLIGIRAGGDRSPAHEIYRDYGSGLYIFPSH